MKKILSLVIASTLLALTLGACVEDGQVRQQTALDREPGTYERTTTYTDSAGTTVKKKSSTEVSVDKYGNKKAVVKSKTTKDPKVLFNKETTSETKQEIEEGR